MGRPRWRRVTSGRCLERDAPVLMHDPQYNNVRNMELEVLGWG